MINEKYNELLQEIAKIIAEKHVEAVLLNDEINRLKNQLENVKKGKGKDNGKFIRINRQRGGSV